MRTDRAAQGAQGMDGAASDGLVALKKAEDGCLVCVGCGQRQPAFSCKCGARYCGVACQKADWSAHRKACAWRAAEKRVAKSEKAASAVQ